MASKKSAASKAKKTVAKKAPAKKAPTKTTKPKKAAAAKTAASSTSKKTAAKTPAAKKKSPAKKAPTSKTSTQKKSKETVSSKPTAKQPAKSKFDKKFIDEMEKQLHEERAKYVHSAEVLKAEADSLMEDREPGDVQFDEESGEGDTLAVERERDLALSAQARHSVDQIDQALDRIKDGTYGVCNQSGLPIPKERLRAIPWALERVEYKAMGLGRR